jgi:hypothetical protein
MTTQSTVLALEALLTADARSSEPAVGNLVLSESESEVGSARLTSEDYDVVRQIELSPEAGKRTFAARFAGVGGLRYQLSANRRVAAAGPLR